MGDEIVNQVKRIVTSIRNSGSVINIAIVKATGRGVVLSADRSLFLENGGHKFKFPNGFHITESENHWANTRTMNDYIDKIIIPYVNKDDCALPLGQL